MAQNGTKIKLTGKKQKVAEKLADPEFKGSITKLLKECGVPRRTYYNWLDDKDFCKAVNDLIEKYTDSELSRVWKSLVRNCDKGDTQAIKLFFELKGKYKQNIEHAIDADIKTINPYDALTVEELRALAKRCDNDDSG